MLEIISIPSPIRDCLIFYIYMVGGYSENILENSAYLACQLGECGRVLAAEDADINHCHRFCVAASEVQSVFRLETDHEPVLGFAGNCLDCFSEERLDFFFLGVSDRDAYFRIDKWHIYLISVHLSTYNL